MPTSQWGKKSEVGGKRPRFKSHLAAWMVFYSAGTAVARYRRVDGIINWNLFPRGGLQSPGAGGAGFH